MNKVYKLVWSKVRNCYVAVSEIAKSRTKAPKSGVIGKAVVAGVLACVMSCGAVMPAFAVNTDNSTYGNTETDTATGNNNVAVVSYIADVPTLPAPPSPDGGTTTATSANAVDGVNNIFIGSVGYDYNYTVTGPLATVRGTSNIGIGNTSGRYATMITDTNFKGGGDSEQTSIEKNIYLGNVTADGSAYTSAIYGIGKTENNIVLGNVYSAANSYVSLTNTQDYGSTIKGNILIGNNDGTYYNGSAIKSKNNATVSDNIAIGNTSGAALLEGQSGDYLFRNNVVLGMAKGENGSIISQKNDNVTRNMALMNMTGNRVGISDSSNAVALGSNSATYSTNNNFPAMVEGEAAISIGKDFHVKGNDAIVMGTESTALSDSAVSIGKRATVEGTNSIALGNESIVLEGEENVVSFGHGSSSSVKNTVENSDITYNNELSRRLIHVAAGVNDTDAVNVSQLNEAIANASGGGGASYIGINSAVGGANEDGSGAIGTDAIAIGRGASANDTNAIAIGMNANTKKSTGSIDSSIAIGNNAKAWADINDTETDSAISAIAIGKDAKAEGTGAVSIGYISQAKSTSGAAFGRYSKALGASSTALGSEAVANGSSDVAIGFDAKTAENKQRSTAIGSSSFSNANGSVALGNQSTASERYVVSVGHLVGDLKSNGTAYEDNLKRRIVSVEDGTASHNAATVGQTIELVAGDNVTIAPDTTEINSIGQKRYKISAVSSDGGSTPYIGINSASGGANEDGSGAVGTDSIAIGRGAEAKDVRAVAIGMEASTGEPNPTNNDISIAIGWKAKASGQPEGDTDTNREYSSIAIGVKADAENRYSVAVGDHSVATGESSVSIGRSTEATKINGVAIGSYAVANGAYSIAEGRLATTYGFDSIAIGSNAKAGEENVTTKSHQVAIGSDSKADGDNAVALGYNTKVNGKNSVALGSSSIATEDSVISVGSSTAKRRIVNVADGSSATDVATVGQTIELVVGDNITITDDGINDIGQKKLVLSATSGGATTPYIGINSAAGGANEDGSGAVGTNSIAIGHSALATTNDSTVIGHTATVSSNARGMVLGNSAKLENTATEGQNVVSGLVIGNNAKVISTGKNARSAVAIGSDASVIDSTGAVALGNSAAVNGDYSMSVGNNARASGSGSTTIGYNSYSKDNWGTAIGSYARAGNGDDTSTTDKQSATALGSYAYALGMKSVAIGSHSAVQDGTINGKTYDGYESVAIGTSAETGGRHAVVIGASSKAPMSGGVVIGAESYAYRQDSVAIGANAKAGLSDTNKGTSAIAIGANTNAVGNASVVLGRNSNSYGTESLVLGYNSTAGNIKDAATNYNIAIGSNVKAANANSIAAGYKSQALADNAVAMGYAASAAGKKSAAIGSDSVAGEDNVVSFGHSKTDESQSSTSYNEELKRRLIHVADGTSATDAAALGQTIELLNGTNTIVTADGVNDIGQKKYKIDVASNGTITEGNTGLVTGGTVYDAIQAIDIPESTVYTAGNGLKLEDNAFSVVTDGVIETSNMGVLKGGTVYNEVRPDQNGIFVKNANTVGQNLLVLDSELSAVKGRMDDAVIYNDSTHAKATLTGGTAGTTLDNVKNGLISKTSKEAINGGQLWSVKQDIEGFAADIERNKNSIQTLNGSVSNALASVAAANTLVNTVNDLKADASLNNLSDAGKQVISNAAIDAVQQYMASQEADANTSSLNTSNRTMKTNKRVDGLSLSLMASPGADANYVVYDDAEASQITLEDASGEGTKVTNVAEGSLSAASSDAVNGAQLYKTNQNVAALQDTISLNNGTIASLQTDTQKVKTDMLSLQSQYATTKNQVESGFNVTVNGAKVKTVTPESAYIDFVAGDGIDITADNGSVKISGSVHTDGQVASGDVNAVSGDTVYQEVRPAADGNYIKTADTTSANLTSLDTALNTEVSERSSAVTALQETDTALSNRIGVLSEDGDYVRKDASVSANLYSLDEALYDKADYDAANIGKNLEGSSSEQEANARQWGEALGTGNIEGGDSRLVTGDTVNVEVRPAYDGEYVKVNSSVGNNLLSLDEHVLANREDIDSHAEAISDLKDLSSLSDSGKEVIRELAAGAVDVTGSDTVTVEKSTVDGVNYFKVSAKADGLVAYNNKGVVTGGKLFEELRPVEDGSFVEGRNTVAANLTVLDAQIKANKDAIAELSGSGSSGVDLSNTVVYDSSKHDKVTFDGGSVGTTLTNVHSGVLSRTSKDAVNGSQLWAVKQDIEGFAEDIRRNSNNIQTLNGSVSNALSSVAAANTLVNTVNDLKADASLNNLSAAGKQVIANAAMDAVQQYMANKSSVDPSANLNSNYYTINVADLVDNLSGSDNLGDFKQNRNDSLLTTSLRKVNPADASTNYVVYDDSDSSAITLEGADGTKVSNVADGMLSADSKDAVNGKQLFEMNTRVGVLDSKLKTVSDDVGLLRTDVDGLQADMDGLKTGLDGLQVDIGGKADSNLTNISDEGKDVVRGLAKKSLQVSSGEYVIVDKQDVDGVDDYHINVVADGEVADGNDGIVTGGKVFEALSHIDVSDERIRNVVKEDLAGKADKDLSNLSDNGKEVIRDVVKPDLDKKADVNASNIDVAAWSDKLGVGNVTEGDNGLVKGGAVYEAIKDIRSNDLMAVDEYSIRLGGNAKYDAYDVVDVSKSDGSGRVMTGIVVNPDDPNSAVNVGYVDALGQNIVNSVNDGLRKVDDKINKVGAGAAAMASLAPLPFDDDQKWNVSAAVGTYKGEQSGAVGVFFKPQDNVMLNLRGSFGNGENMGGAGVTVGLNKGAAHGLSKVAMAKAMNAQAVEIANQKQLIVNQQEQLNVARAEIEELKALVNTVVSNADKG